MRSKLFAVLSAAPLLLSLNVGALAQATVPEPKTIEVTGHGDSSAKPDLMTLSFTVNSHADSADECTRQESEISQRVVDALKKELGDSAKVSTSDFSFNPSFEYGTPVPTPTSAVRAEPPATWEFKADVNAFTESLEPIGDLIQTGLAAGATSVGQTGIGEMPLDQDTTTPAAENPKSGSVLSSREGPAYQRFKRMYFVGFSIEALGTSAPDCVRRGAAIVGRVEAALKKQIGTQSKVSHGLRGDAEARAARGDSRNGNECWRIAPQSSQLHDQGRQRCQEGGNREGFRRRQVEGRYTCELDGCEDKGNPANLDERAGAPLRRVWESVHGRCVEPELSWRVAGGGDAGDAARGQFQRRRERYLSDRIDG